MNANSIRTECLEEAARLTANERQRDYGDPVAGMQHIADIFNAWTGRDLTAREVSQVLTSVKLARSQATALHRDSYVDSMAYRGIELECATAEAEQ